MNLVLRVIMLRHLLWVFTETESRLILCMILRRITIYIHLQNLEIIMPIYVQQIRLVIQIATEFGLQFIILPLQYQFFQLINIHIPWVKILFFTQKATLQQHIL